MHHLRRYRHLACSPVGGVDRITYYLLVSEHLVVRKGINTVITTRISTVLSEDGYKKLHAYARAKQVDVRSVAAGVIEAFLDGRAPSEFEPKAKRHTGETRLVQEIRGMFLNLGAQSIADLLTCGRSELSVRKAVMQLHENGEVIKDVAEKADGALGRTPYIYVPVPTKMRAAAERYESTP